MRDWGAAGQLERERKKGDWRGKRKNIEREKLERGEKSVEFNQSGDRTSRDRLELEPLKV